MSQAQYHEQSTPARTASTGQLEHIRQLRARGWGWQAIAQSMGRCREDVERLASVEHATVVRPKAFGWSPVSRATIEAMMKVSASYEQMAREVGCSLAEAEAEAFRQRGQAREAAKLARREAERRRIQARRKAMAEKAVPKPPEPLPVPKLIPAPPSVTRKPNTGNTPWTVATLAAWSLNTTLPALAVVSRRRELARARQYVAWAVREHCPEASYPAIGRLLGGRDHTTIMHGIARMKALLAQGEYADARARLAAELKERVAA